MSIKDHQSDPYSYSNDSSNWHPRAPRDQYPLPPQQGGHSAPPPYPSHQQSAPATTATTSGAPQSAEMVTLPPPQHIQQDAYRAHGSYDVYQSQPQHLPYPPPGHHQNAPQPQVNFSQPAPRQRTAIACRYCRRRKIRCHGFDSSPDGRCTNCLRFHQECIFTPVSSQAHAFVPAHTAYPHLRNTGRMQQTPDGRPIYPQGQPIIYGAHGQPLGAPMVQMGHDPNYPPPPQSYGASPYPGPGYEDRGHPPPHQPDQQRLATSNPRRSSGGNYEYPDPTHMAPVSPASSSTSYHTAPYPPQPQQQPYYPPPQVPRRSSPQSAYSYDARASGSPPGNNTSTPPSYPSFPGGLHPPQVLPPTLENVRTPPPGQPREGAGNGNGSRPGMSVRDMLGPGENSQSGQGARSSADSDMLKALSRRGM